ncbi:MAG: inositol monophosphatase [Bacteroidaceae bacterium]|nr:inositol monophosphatase [Bacteroidaceae bacterium]
MEKINLRELSDKLEDIVRDAAKPVYDATFDISLKEGFANIVTSTDVAVQEYLRKELTKVLPGCGFLCEEEDFHNLGSEYTWIIDPIDGTANYSRKIDQCAICVGLKYGKDIVLSAVYLPFTDEFFSAIKGKGAFLNGRSIHVSERPFQDSILCTALAVYHKQYARVCSAIIVDTFLQCNDIRRFGAAAPEICYLAMGRCELYFEYLLSPWDFAAASLILSEAGGVFCDLRGKKTDFLHPTGFLAANSRKSLDRLVEIVQSHIEE